MNEELMSFVASLLENTQLKMDEYQTPEMAFTSVALDKIAELLDCNDPVIEHCKLTKTNGDTIGEIHAYAESVNGEVLFDNTGTFALGTNLNGPVSLINNQTLIIALNN